VLLVLGLIGVHIFPQLAGLFFKLPEGPHFYLPDRFGGYAHFITDSFKGVPFSVKELESIHKDPPLPVHQFIQMVSGIPLDRVIHQILVGAIGIVFQEVNKGRGILVPRFRVQGDHPASHGKDILDFNGWETHLRRDLFRGWVAHIELTEGVVSPLNLF